jgi:hypothetical protein
VGLDAVDERVAEALMIPVHRELLIPLRFEGPYTRAATGRSCDDRAPIRVVVTVLGCTEHCSHLLIADYERAVGFPRDVDQSKLTFIPRRITVRAEKGVKHDTLQVQIASAKSWCRKLLQ